MEYSKSRFTWLFYRYHDNTCTQEEQDEFLELVANERNNEELKQLLNLVIEEQKADKKMDDTSADRLFANIVKKAEHHDNTAAVSWRLFRKTAVAASVLLITGLILYTVLLSSKSKDPTATAQKLNERAKEIEPGGNKAVLTLTDGSQILLDSAGNGLLTQQGNVEIEKKANGELSYNADGAAATTVQYNSISTPRGGQYKLILSDGTAVWLNSASLIRYPIVFTGDTREVEISGEVYFEVAKDAAKLFVVKRMNNPTTIKVLGTHFNVNAYDDDSEIKVTLLEGSVQVANNSRQNILKPGQQAAIENDNIRIAQEIDIDEVMAWKNGEFNFGEKSSIEDVMRQLARWYDLEVEYREKVTTHFWGSISRAVNASEIFKMLEATGGVKFKVEGKKVIVMR